MVLGELVQETQNKIFVRNDFLFLLSSVKEFYKREDSVVKDGFWSVPVVLGLLKYSFVHLVKFLKGVYLENGVYDVNARKYADLSLSDWLFCHIFLLFSL